MARLPQLMEIAKRFNMKIIAIKDLVAYRMRTERIIKKDVTAHLPTQYGNFEVHAYTQLTTGDTHLAIKMGNWKKDEPVLVRAHSSSGLGDILDVLFDDFDSTIQKSLEIISKEGKGLFFIYATWRKRPIYYTKAKNIQQKTKQWIKASAKTSRK